MRDTCIDQELCIFLVEMLKTVSISFINSKLLNWLEHFILRDCFQFYSGNNNKSLLLYACEVIHLINKSANSQDVQE